MYNQTRQPDPEPVCADGGRQRAGHCPGAGQDGAQSAGQIPSGSQRRGSAAVHAEPDRRVGHRRHGRPGRAAAQNRPILEEVKHPHIRLMNFSLYFSR